ncbi:MAG: class II aldolase/adducin family protein, partial [Candidatus Omnitrophica bacterium]|nr:class II aldolase/adducin family protein [Candidatus Omnitrophota bacterium]
DIGAIVHTHCPHATAFSVAGLALDQAVLPEQIYTLGAIPLAPYGQPGTHDLYQGMLPYIEKSNAFLLKNHGVVTYGKDLWEAFFSHEALEHAARIQILARQVGKVETLKREQVDALHRARTEAGLDPHWIDCRCDDDD